MCPKGKSIIYDNRNTQSKSIIKKSGIDDMRAFFDFCMDFMADERTIDTGVDYADIDILLEWVEDPELLKMAIINIKNKKG